MHKVELAHGGIECSREADCRGVVNKDVYAPEYLNRLLNRNMDGVFIPYIHHNWQRPPAGPFHIFRRRINRTGQPGMWLGCFSGDDYVCAFPGCAKTDGVADAPAGACDEEGLFLERWLGHWEYIPV